MCSISQEPKWQMLLTADISRLTDLWLGAHTMWGLILTTGTRVRIKLSDIQSVSTGEQSHLEEKPHMSNQESILYCVSNYIR